MRSRSWGVGIRSCCEPGSPAGRARSMAGANVGGRGAATMVRAAAATPPPLAGAGLLPRVTCRLHSSHHTNHRIQLWRRCLRLW